jgi:hypothetical protein
VEVVGKKKIRKLARSGSGMTVRKPTTVHAPQPPPSHPCFAPVKPESRRNSSRLVWELPLPIVILLPLSQKVMAVSGSIIAVADWKAQLNFFGFRGVVNRRIIYYKHALQL